MIERYGAKGTDYGEIFFTEEPLLDGISRGAMRVEISRQNSNLGEVKKRLAAMAAQRGANAIGDFRYGQRKHKTWQLLFTFMWDTESWYGEGTAMSHPAPPPAVRASDQLDAGR